VHIPLGTAEPEAVGELPPQRGPELNLLLLGQVQHAIVVALKLLVLLGYFREGLIRAMGCPIAVGRSASITTAAASIFLRVSVTDNGEQRQIQAMMFYSGANVPLP
jgi:hypothetical protein